MKASVVRPGELGPEQLALWRDMRAEVPHLRSAFLAPEYALALDECRDDVRVAVLSDAGATVGFFAFEQRGRGVAKPLGHGLTDTEAIVHGAGRVPVVQDVLRASGLSGWDFETLVAEQVPPGAQAVERRPCPVMDLSEGFPAYLEARKRESKKIVQGSQRKLRKLEREVGPVTFVFAEQDPVALKTLMAWKSAQYKAMDEWDRFAEPRVIELVERLHQSEARDCAGTLSVLSVAGKPLAAHFGLAGTTSLATWFPAYDAEFSAFSPGILLHFAMAEAAVERGITELNLGRGHHEYKEALKTGDLTVVRGSVDAGRVSALSRKIARMPRTYLRPWLRKHPKLEHAIAVRLSKRRLG